MSITEQKFKRGDVRADGLIFLRYRKVGRNILEHWVSDRAFQKNLQATRDWCLKNKARYLANVRRHRENHLPESLDRTARFKVKRAGGFVSEVHRETILQFYIQAIRLTRCLGIKFDVDHVIPMGRGGSHHPANLACMPRALNQAKHDRLPGELPKDHPALTFL